MRFPSTAKYLLHLYLAAMRKPHETRSSVAKRQGADKLKNMQMVRLVYASKLRTNVDPSELAKIHDTALQYNKKQGLTGVLLFGDDSFLQCLEGGSEAVNALYANIANDPRHEQCFLIDYSEIAERDFDQWAMKLILLTDKKIKSLLKYTVNGTFDPSKMSAASALSFIRSLKEQTHQA